LEGVLLISIKPFSDFFYNPTFFSFSRFLDDVGGTFLISKLSINVLDVEVVGMGFT